MKKKRISIIYGQNLFEMAIEGVVIISTASVAREQILQNVCICITICCLLNLETNKQLKIYIVLKGSMTWPCSAVPANPAKEWNRWLKSSSVEGRRSFGAEALARWLSPRFIYNELLPRVSQTRY